MNLTTEISNGELTCVQCSVQVQLGRDYCDICEMRMLAGVANRVCSFCAQAITEEQLEIGFCGCGKPTSNAPPITIRMLDTDIVSEEDMRDSIDMAMKEASLFLLADTVFDRR